MADLMIQTFNAIYSNAGQKIRDSEAHYYHYRVTGQGFNVSGLIGLIPHEKFASNFVVPHVQTLPDKELSYSQSLLDLRMQINPVLLFYRGHDSLSTLLKLPEYRSEPILEKVNEGVKHQLSRIIAPKLHETMVGLERLYVADGHHRIKSSLLAAQYGQNAPQHCLSMLVSADSLHIGSINRCIKHDAHIDIDQIFTQIERYWDMLETSSLDMVKNECRLYVQGRWYTLRFKKKLLENMLPFEKLHSCILENYLLKPVFAVEDQRFDSRLQFVPDQYDEAHLEQMIASGEVDVAICIPPLSIDELCQIADQGYTIPPHSTYLQPKALDGMISWGY